MVRVIGDGRPRVDPVGSQRPSRASRPVRLVPGDLGVEWGWSSTRDHIRVLGDVTEDRITCARPTPSCREVGAPGIRELGV
jgi:hypothetical protein